MTDWFNQIATIGALRRYNERPPKNLHSKAYLDCCKRTPTAQPHSISKRSEPRLQQISQRGVRRPCAAQRTG
jgi:hypothetical protein